MPTSSRPRASAPGREVSPTPRIATKADAQASTVTTTAAMVRPLGGSREGRGVHGMTLGAAHRHDPAGIGRARPDGPFRSGSWQERRGSAGGGDRLPQDRPQRLGVPTDAGSPT